MQSLVLDRPAPPPWCRPNLTPRRAALGAVAVLLGLGLAVRLRQYLGGMSFWYDEAYVLLNVFHRSWPELLGAIDHMQALPPLALWLLRAAYLLLGPSELAMRLPAFVAGLAALLVMVPLARRLVGPPGWPGAVALCALSAHAVMHACEVKPYAADLLVAECVPLAAAAWLRPAGTPRGRRLGLAGLGLLALLGPWLSFPAAFALGAAGLALFVEACQRPSRARWLAWAGFNAVLLASGSVLWQLHARHLYYTGMAEFWRLGFPPDGGPARHALWALGRLVEVGNYGTTGMGVPLLVLAAVGAAHLARHAMPLAVLLVGPPVLGLVACSLRKYPLDDRLLLFAVPSLWLLAAAGAGACLRLWQSVSPKPPGRAAWAGGLIFAALLTPGVVEAVKETLWVEARVEFREAFAYVHRHWQPTDSLYVLHDEVYQAYFGRPRHLLGHATPLPEIERAVRGGRLWLIFPQTSAPWEIPVSFFPRLEVLNCARHDHPSLGGLYVVLYTPCPPGVPSP